ITYIHLGKGCAYLAVLLDVYTRAIRGWGLSPWLDQDLTLVPLQRALATGRVPAIHHSDQGVQYASSAYVDLLAKYHVQVSMAAQGKPEENGYAERVIRTIKEEEVELAEYADFADALAQMGHFIEEVYQKKRIHSALGYLTPVEFEAAWQESQPEAATSLARGQNLSNSRGPLH
ncbi:MAG: integrase core domain-containing protein, partial [Candidatus Acetothermia bacterium]|nr:integrase core domain-containing protein [Candidatus Acetothermia bacterium]